MAFPLDKSSYIKAGDDKGLFFTDDIAPPTVYDKCNWSCQTCGRKYFKTYRAVYLGKHGCRCQNSMSISLERYEEVAVRYGLKLVRKANNYTEPSTWRTVNGDFCELSYYELVHAPYKSREKLRLAGVNIVERPSKEARDYNDPKRLEKTKKKILEQRALTRLPNQEEEQGIIEIYD